MESREQVNIKELVGAALAGDSGAYEALYNATATQMLGLARSMLRHEEDALDVLQESYLYAFKSLGSLQQPEHFRTWLYSIVSNRCKNFLTRTRPKLFAASTTDEEGDDWEIEDSDLSFQPQESVDYTETQRIVWEMVDTLPEDQRACVLLYYFQEMKVGEIARLLDVSGNTVSSRLGYARKKLLTKAEELERKGDCSARLYVLSHYGDGCKAGCWRNFGGQRANYGAEYRGGAGRHGRCSRSYSGGRNRHRGLGRVDRTGGRYTGFCRDHGRKGNCGCRCALAGYRRLCPVLTPAGTGTAGPARSIHCGDGIPTRAGVFT